jgi:hypothetical protein
VAAAGEMSAPPARQDHGALPGLMLHLNIQCTSMYLHMCILDPTYLSAELITMRISSRSVGSGLLIREREATGLPLQVGVLTYYRVAV